MLTISTVEPSGVDMGVSKGFKLIAQQSKGSWHQNNTNASARKCVFGDKLLTHPLKIGAGLLFCTGTRCMMVAKLTSVFAMCNIQFVGSL